MKNRFLFLFLGIFLFLIILVFFSLKPVKKNAYFIINNQKLKVELALSSAEQQKGLANRKNIALDAGLLFIFSQPDIYGFWMQGMLFPIDIIWLDADFKIVHLVENVSPDSFPQVFKNEIPALYVLEVSANFVQKNNLTLNQKLDFYRQKAL